MIADKHAINRVRMTRQVLTFAALVLLPSLALSKRSEPAKVDPVIHEGIRYIAPNDDGRRGYIEAWEIQTNKKLWELTVFTNRLDLKLEEDVQWVFIKSLSQQDGMLVVTSERGKTYQVDLKTKAIIQSILRSRDHRMRLRNVMTCLGWSRKRSPMVRSATSTKSRFT